MCRYLCVNVFCVMAERQRVRETERVMMTVQMIFSFVSEILRQIPEGA